jgi:hypothetical protein
MPSCKILFQHIVLQEKIDIIGINTVFLANTVYIAIMIHALALAVVLI